jgi:hypothetical protein
VKPDAGWKSALAFPRVDEWTGFLLGTFGVMLGAAAFNFISTASTLAVGPRVLGSLEYGGKLVLAALVGGLIVWGAMRIIKGEDAPEAKETVLWSACLLATLVSAVQMFR